MKTIKIVTIIIILQFFISSLTAQNEALWLRYPAISPNGKEIAFCYKGNIYKVDSEGGEALPLTMSEEHCFKPVWSPNGEKIAFASKLYGNYDIFVMNSDGSNLKRITYFSKNEIPFSFTSDGKSLVYKTWFLFDRNSAIYSVFYNQLYKVNIETGHISQFLSIPAQNVSLCKNNNLVLFEDVKGHYSYFRKHDKSPAARDIWVFDKESDEFTKLTNFKGEDREPSFNYSGETVYFLSERYNSNLNVCKFPISNPNEVSQVTSHENHPVRSLTVSNSNDLCYSYNGELYLKKEGAESFKIPITINIEPLEQEANFKTYRNRVSEYDISPNGKEVAFIVRGDIYVTSTIFETTRQITKTSQIERDVSYAPDGKSLIYSSLRDGSWNIYETTFSGESQQGFLYANALDEHEFLKSKKTEIEPKYSPDGNYIAYYEDWNTLMLYDIGRKNKRVILPNHHSFVYEDDTRKFEWSPNSNWLLFEYSPQFMFKTDIGAVRINEPSKVINLTQSGFNDYYPKWGNMSNMFIWLSDRDGYKDVANYRADRDVYAGFFTQKGFEVFNYSDEEYLLYQKDSARLWTNHIYELDKVRERQVRLTTNSSKISDAILSGDNERLFYFCHYNDGFDLWVLDIRSRSSRMVKQFNGVPQELKISIDGENLFFISEGNIYKVNTTTFEIKTIRFKAKQFIDQLKERQAVFEEFFALIKDKFYDKNLHNTNWNFYKKAYEKFLPHINNDIDFAEMLSEMMGELNVSHSGVRYLGRPSGRDATATLAFFPDFSYKGDGVRIAEIIEGSPLARFDSQVKDGDIIQAINREKVKNLNHFFELLNHKTRYLVPITFYNQERKKAWTETITPIGFSDENTLLYKRWVTQREKQVNDLSSGQLGYIHIKSMSVSTFRKLYSDILGKYKTKKAIIVDIRTSSGGWIHDDLLTLLNGEKYADFYNRGAYFGSDPAAKWYKPSILLMNENNRSDASGFAHFYKELGIGKIVGLPNQGTFSAITRISAINPLLKYYIPHVGAKNKKGQFLENLELQPDYKVKNEYEMLLKGKDQQLEKTIEIMLKQLENND